MSAAAIPSDRRAAVPSPRKTPALPGASRLPMRVLESGRAPAQRSLFQGLGPR